MRDRATFRALVAGQRHFRGALTMTCVRSAESGPPRVAYAVPRSVGNAVVRNRVRRRLRDLMRRHATELRDGHAYLVRASARAADATYADLDTALRALLAVAEPSR